MLEALLSYLILDRKVAVYIVFLNRIKLVKTIVLVNPGDGLANFGYYTRNNPGVPDPMKSPIFQSGGSVTHGAI